MPKKSGRQRKKTISLAVKNSKPTKNVSKTKKTRNKGKSPISTDSETSPCKGFDTNPKIPKSLCDTENKDPLVRKLDLFDTLLDDGYKRKFDSNMKTYANKKKSPVKNTPLLEFHDHRNRNDVVKWLNDNRNVFDRLTQTQDVIEDVGTQMTLDMPSVSQQNTPKPKREAKKKRRSPYKLRARSLDIKVQKNERRGRNKRHSLAGDTPEFENYHIEEIVTSVEALVPAEENAKIIVDLMEDEYLDKLEEEILQCDKKSSGWDRIRDLNKTINPKKQPKKLKITVQETPSSTRGDVNSNSNLCYDYNLFENYFIETTEKLKIKASLENVLQVGKIFLTLLEELSANDRRDCLEQLPLDKLLSTFSKSTEIKAPEIVSKEVQTGTTISHSETQTNVKTVDKILQTEDNTVSIGVQYEKTDLDVSCQVSSASSVTKSDVFPMTCDRQTPDDVFDDDLNFNFDTEELLKAENDRNKGTKRLLESPKSSSMKRHRLDSETSTDPNGEGANSVLVVSAEVHIDANRGEKRVITPEAKESKRPSAKFIEEDLSVGFSSCVEEDEDGEKKVAEWTGGSENDECLLNLVSKYETIEPKTAKTRTQEQIEELEAMITNATKSNRPQKQNAVLNQELSVTDTKRSGLKQTTQEHIQELEDVIYNATKNKRPIEPEERISLEDDMDYFQTSNSDKTNVRRSLFNLPEEKDAFSESMFGEQNTVVANKTLTNDNECGKVEKVNILEDFVLKPRDESAVMEVDDEGNFSDVDFVECTPQAEDVPSFNQREESALDVTLPPPLEFQDSEKQKVLDDQCIVKPDFLSPPRRPLAAINKITSTPDSQKPDSENFLSLSPISQYGKGGKKTKQTQDEKSIQENYSSRQSGRVLGPFELARRQASKFSPLTIVKKPLSQDSLSGTPKQKSILTYVRPSQESQDSQKSESFDSSFKRKPCIACSRVSKEQIIAISSLTNKKLATYSTSFTPKVTHLIVAVNEKNCLKDHTIKYVSAVAAGAWILSFEWIRECLVKNALVPEKPYEVLDVSGHPGPQKSRLMRKNKPLFKGYKIFAAPPFASTTRDEVENVVRLLGAKIVRSPEQLLDKSGYICVIITEARATQDFELYETWLEALRVVTVDIEWLSRSVGQYQLLSLRPFALCSDDMIETLGYPSELTANMTYSFSQQTFSTVPSTK